jgi:hypothetical protein
MLDDPKIEEINFLTQGLVRGPQMSKTGRTILDQVSFVGAPISVRACRYERCSDRPALKAALKDFVAMPSRRHRELLRPVNSRVFA